MARKRKAKRPSRALMRLGASTPVCPRPSYAAVLSGDALGGLVQVAFVGGGAFAGWLLLGGPGRPPQNAMMGMALGGTAGLLAGAYPSLLAQRAATRSTTCPQPGMGRLLGYWAAKVAAAGAVGAVTRTLAPENKVLSAVAGTGMFFGAPVLGKAILRT